MCRFAWAVAGWLFASTAFAQEPAAFPDVSSQPLAAGAEPVEDPDLIPAQFTVPGGVQGMAAPGTYARPVVDPPAPVVRVQVRVPADSPPGDDIKYVITVRNTSTAEAHGVTVRNPLSDAVADVVKADPPPAGHKPGTPLHTALTANKAGGRELVWHFGTLRPNDAKTIELVLKPRPDAAEVKNFAYVRFEYGEAVATKVRKPALKVTKSAPKQTVRDEPFRVAIVVENTSRVPTANVKVTENVPAAAEFEAVTAGAKKTQPGQFQWQVGTLLPGQRKVLEYRLTPRQVAETLTTTNVDADKSLLETAEARTAVLVPGLGAKLLGPDRIVGPGETARYEVTVRNTGTLASANVRITATLPADCKPSTMTNGGQLYRDQIVWTVPRLEAGEAQAFRFGLKAPTSGSRPVSVHVIDGRGMKAKEELATVFQGAAALTWETTPDPASVAVGRQGTFTVRVKNGGGEPARNVRVEVEVPPDVDVVQATRDVRPTGRKIVFGPETVPAHGEAVFTVTYKAMRSAEAWFKAKLSADALGDRPLTTEKVVDLRGS